MKTKPDSLHLETHTPRIIALILLAACLLLIFNSCWAQAAGNNSAAGLDPATSTVYALVSVDGKAVPCVLTHEDTTMTVQAGSFTMATNNCCGTSMTITVGTNKAVNILRQATYEQSGNELTMKWKGFGSTKGTLAGDDFTMNNEGMIFVYHKSPH
jgi:hypothetical protein